MLEKPFANICNDFARLDKVEIVYRHRIQYESREALRSYIQRLTDDSELFQPCWRANPNRTLVNQAARVRLPYQFAFRDTDGMITGRTVILKPTRSHPDTVSDMHMHLSLNFQRFWQQNIHAHNFPIRTRGKRREIAIPDNFNLSELFTLNPNAFPETSDTFTFATNMLDGEHWHDTADVSALFSKQLFFVRDYIEAQFPLRNNLAHSRLQTQAIDRRLPNGDTIRLLSQDILTRVGGVAPLFHWGDCYLPWMEVAYDFQCADAMQITQDLMMRLLGVGFSASAGVYDLHFKREDNIPCCNVNLAKNVTIAVYPKSMNRLRIEARFKGSIHSILRRHIDKDTPIPEIIEHAINSATKRTVKMLKQLPSEPSEPIDRSIRMTEFIHHVAHAFGGDHRRIQHFLNSLAIIGSYAHPTRGDGTAYEYLVSHDILQPSRPGLRNTTVQYSITPEYAWIVQTLRARYFEG